MLQCAGPTRTTIDNRVVTDFCYVRSHRHFGQLGLGLPRDICCHGSHQCGHGNNRVGVESTNRPRGVIFVDARERKGFGIVRLISGQLIESARNCVRARKSPVIHRHNVDRRRRSVIRLIGIGFFKSFQGSYTVDLAQGCRAQRVFAERGKRGRERKND